MALAPCGCQIAEQAEREADPRARAVLQEQAIRARAEWGCDPSRPTDASVPLSDRCRRTAQAVGRLVGCDGEEAFQRCPQSYLRDPIAHEAARAHAWWDKGQLALLHPHPSAALVDAIDAIDLATSARLKAEMPKPEPKKDRHG